MGFYAFRLTSRAHLVRPRRPSLGAAHGRALADDDGLSRLCLLVQELGATVEGWTDDLASLFLLRDSLEGVVSTDDITILQERLRLLQRQWEEVCHQVPPPPPLFLLLCGFIEMTHSLCCSLCNGIFASKAAKKREASR